MNGRKTEKMNKIDQKTVYTIKALCADMVQACFIAYYIYMVMA